MKKLFFTILALCGALSALAEEAILVTVIGDRVSVRAEPDLRAVLVTRAEFKETFELADNSNPEWVGVRPPERANFWVNSKYIENGLVVPPRLNVRSGPSLSHHVVGVITRGDVLDVRSELDGWLRIAPMAEATVWISRKYVDVPEPKVVTIVKPFEPQEAEVETAARKEAEQIVRTVLQPVINDLMIAVAEVEELPSVITADSEREQALDGQFTGVLQRAGDKVFKLIDPRADNVTLCYVRGNMGQLVGFEGKPMMLSGKVYWAKELEWPMLVPNKIHIVK